MNLGLEDKKKLGILSVAAVGALGAVVYLYTQLFPSTPPPAPAPPAAASSTTPAKGSESTARSTSNPSEKPLATTAAALDPSLHMGAMLTTEALIYEGAGRNIFSTSSAVVNAAALPRPIASARTQPTPVYVPPGPPPPPRIDIHFFGTAASSGRPIRALLLRGEDVFLASAGDIVGRRYKVVAVSANSVTIQDLSNNNQQSIPLTSN